MRGMAGLMLLLLLALSPRGHAETADAKKAPPPRKIRFLALGDAPPFQQEVRDGVRYELEPPEGSVPPREIVPSFGEKEKDQDPGKQPEPIRLNLGRITPPSTIPDGAGLLELRKKDASGDSKPWLSLQRPEHGDLMVLLWRDPRGKSWEQTSALIIADSPDSPGPGGVQMLNLIPVTVGVTLGTEKIALPYARIVTKKPELKQDLPLEVNALSADLKTPGKRFLSTVLAINAGECNRVLIYRADGVSPRTPVKVLILREPIGPAEDAPALPSR
ncbi:MAG: hypothetical protein JWO82_1108 [Akkermansiaceae bacterium]|nr:hypothetical protein [Akkermansiaceae bacterium]